MTRAQAAAGARWRFVSTDPSDPELAAAIASLQGAFSTANGSHSTVRRTWIDTFDGRLGRAGIVLEHVTRDGEAYLELTEDDGQPLRTPAPSLTWPAFAADLPPGPLRERLLPVTDIRALLATATLRSRLQDIRVLDDDGKTVARLLVDVPGGRAGGSTQAASRTILTVSAVRGYQAQAASIAAVLAATPGVAASSRSRRDDAVAAAGGGPRQLPFSPATPLTDDLPAAQAVATVLDGFRFTLEANLPGLVADLDTEFLHDFRVAVRRARSTIKLTGHVLPADRVSALGAELKWLGELTSPTRDLDVYLLGFPTMAASLRSSPAEDLQPFQQHLAQRRALEQRRLIRGVRSRRFRELLELWRRIGEHYDAAVFDPAATAIALARTSTERARRRVAKLGSRICATSPAEDLHTLRRRCKELRYLLEMFASLHDSAAHKRVLQVLKALQECLGDFQDSEVQTDALRAFAGEMSAAGTAAPGTLLAMGELAAALHADQQRARAAFGSAFATFMRPRNQRSFDALLPAAPGRDDPPVPTPLDAIRPRRTASEDEPPRGGTLLAFHPGGAA